MDKKKNNVKTLTGEVVSNKMNKTVVVKVTETYAHPKYKKILKIYRRFKAHSEDQLEIGQKVIIEETRKLSKDKAFKVVKILENK